LALDLLVEQLADRALAIADDVIVLDIGRVILRHDTAPGRHPAVLEAACFGRQQLPRTPPAPRASALVRGLCPQS
jgi:hypothetical protein